jgi:hypothetical protein
MNAHANSSLLNSSKVAHNVVRIIDGKVVVFRQPEIETSERRNEIHKDLTTIGKSKSDDEDVESSNELRELCEIAKHECRTDIVNSVKRSTLAWRLKQRSPRQVMDELIIAHNIRSGKCPTDTFSVRM